VSHADEHDDDCDDCDMDCEDCLSHLYEYVDGELTPAMAQAISDHIADCGECLTQFKFEQAFLAFLEARPELAKAPPALREKILRRILSQQEPSA
jgi:anti-sigma factor (TIGR02949 family)